MDVRFGGGGLIGKTKVKHINNKASAAEDSKAPHDNADVTKVVLKTSAKPSQV